MCVISRGHHKLASVANLELCSNASPFAAAEPLLLTAARIRPALSRGIRYTGAAAFKSPLVSKGTKVLSGGGGSGGNELAHCLKRTTGRTPTASDYA
jgi:hypothetical protein